MGLKYINKLEVNYPVFLFCGWKLDYGASCLRLKIVKVRAIGVSYIQHWDFSTGI